MIAKINGEAEFHEYNVAASFVGVGFDYVQLDAKDFEHLASCPDLKAWIENVQARMVPTK